MYFSCFTINFSLHAIIYKYLISLSIITSIELYLSLIVKFVNLSNLIIKFIVTLFYNDLNNF
jgi:hypothetical protein